jgi:uncharacterized protein (TIGR02453 family)
MAFKGFSVSTITFLKDLAGNNNKEWFERHRAVYENSVLEPLKQLAAELGPVILSLDPEIETSPTVNKTISKIYRDIRFSRDKSPFRTGLWPSFRRPKKAWGNVPEFYFYFTPEEYQCGMGFYSATPANMEKFREYIILHHSRFGKIIDLYKTSDIIVGGEEYKKYIPNNLPEDFQNWYHKRNLYVSSAGKIDNSFLSAALKDEISNFFNVNAALYQFIIDSIGFDSKV